MRTRFTMAIAAILLIVAMTPGAVSAAGSGKFQLLGTDGNAWCDGSGVITGTAGGYGFAMINAPSDGTVITTVALKGLQPAAEYQVRLIQGIDDCHTFDATIVTDADGNGNVHWTETSVSSHAFVAVDGPGFSQSFVTQTYAH
jgi:hypothetical protein